MPQLRDITVHVTDANGNPLEEWGVQTLKGNKVSAYVRSITDMPFRVMVQPKIPYLHEDSEEDLIGKPSSSRPALKNRSSLSHPARGALDGATPPFDFLATLYLDGRKKPERRIVVYLDPSDEDFTPPTGRVSFKCRCVQGRDGRLREQAWVFKDVGIETMFDKIALGVRAQDGLDLEEIIVDAMNSSKFGDDPVVTNKDPGKIGQIIIELERVKLGKKYDERNYRAKHKEGDRDNINMEGVDYDVVHTAGFEHLRSLEQKSFRCVGFDPYLEGEGPWATFKFFYRSHEQLQKFNFSGYPQDVARKPPRERRLFETLLANLTPLSITHAKHKAPSLKEKGRSFENRVKEGFQDESKIPKPEYEFHDYRNPRQDDGQDDLGEPRGSVSNGTKRPASMPLIRGAGSDRDGAHDQGASSAVVAVKEKMRSRQKQFFIGARKSSSSSSSLSSPLSSPPNDSSVQPPGNSPTAGFHNFPADPRLSAPKGSGLDIFKTLSDASLALTKAETEPGNDRLTPKSAIRNGDVYRVTSFSSDADADDEKDGESEEGSWESDHSGDGGGSDKENKASADDDDDAGLHEEFLKVSIGQKRQRGEGMEELKENASSEKDGLIIDGHSSGKRNSSANTLPRPSMPAPEQMMEGSKEAVVGSGTAAEEQQSKRVKLGATISAEGESVRD